MSRIDELAFPQLPDPGGIQEFREAFDDHVAHIERDIAALRANPHDGATIASLFRGLHTLKGDAALTKVGVGVEICHPLESLLARCRSGEVRFTPELSELTLLALDRLELALEALSKGQGLASLKLPDLVAALDAISRAPAEEVPARALGAIELVTGAKAHAAIPPALTPSPAPIEKHPDLAFFASLAAALEKRSPLFAGRSERNLKLALATNAMAGKPVDETQLAAAVYFHDVGMMFLPERVWLKAGRLDDEDRAWLRLHPDYAADLLERMPAWKEAATIVRQHHEMPSGSGYPRGLRAEQIHAGAKIIAIVDAFEAIMLKQSHRGHGRSLIRAIAEINANEHQFAPEWIRPFNAVVRSWKDADL
ncbi:MAG: HD domain-containing protein [Rhodocyclaceae bacterium]|nr:HD domain-containing protein [Rhodocyclaceae bacterium]